jgi:hypothetical protein
MTQHIPLEIEVEEAKVIIYALAFFQNECNTRAASEDPFLTPFKSLFHRNSRIARDLSGFLTNRLPPVSDYTDID